MTVFEKALKEQMKALGVETLETKMRRNTTKDQPRHTDADKSSEISKAVAGFSKSKLGQET